MDDGLILCVVTWWLHGLPDIIIFFKGRFFRAFVRRPSFYSSNIGAVAYSRLGWCFSDMLHAIIIAIVHGSVVAAVQLGLVLYKSLHVLRWLNISMLSIVGESNGGAMTFNLICFVSRPSARSREINAMACLD